MSAPRQVCLLSLRDRNRDQHSSLYHQDTACTYFRTKSNVLISCNVDPAISLRTNLLARKTRRRNKSIYLLRGKHVFVDSTFVKWLSLLLQCELLAQASALSPNPNAIWKKEEKRGRSREARAIPGPMSHPRACPGPMQRCGAGRCREPRGRAINLTQSERKIYIPDLETTPVACIHTHAHTHIPAWQKKKEKKSTAASPEVSLETRCSPRHS